MSDCRYECIRIEACPVAERYDYIWLWTGDKVATDEADIPDMSGTKAVTGPVHELESGRQPFLQWSELAG
jgi:phenylpropionate dioxygenase-like ring-hydroxylating dioxygenase large terminal subunit